jgi:PDZ domain/Aspartyl protease
VKSEIVITVLMLCTVRGLCAEVPETSARADALIAASKEASGGGAWDRSEQWHEQGRVSAGGLSGTYEIWASLASLQYFQHYALGPISGSTGWDGARFWTTDSSGEVRIEASGESVAQARQDAYRGVYAFFLPTRFLATREYLGSRSIAGKAYEVVRITPADAEPFEVWFDQLTHLIEREVQTTGAQPHTFIYSDFQHFDGVLVPRMTIDRVGDDPQYDMVSEITALSMQGAVESGRFGPPAPPANTAQWPAGMNAVTVPFRLLNNHIYLMASINGGAPRSFLFDTGATDFIEASTARALGVPMEGALAGGGFGEAITKFGFARIQSVAIGGITLKDQVFGVDYAGFSEFEGKEGQLAGLLGYEFAKRATISIDYAKRRLTFTRPDAFRAPAAAVRIPFTFNAHVPMVAGLLDGAAGEFEIDTGSKSALTIMAPFAKSNDLIEKYHATHSAIIGYGVGGPSRALLARAGELTLGGITIYRPVTAIVTDKGGAAEATHTAGNIGGDLLRRFTVTLDYTHQTLWLQPNAMAFEPDIFDRSGLWISRTSNGHTFITDVTTNSPAAEAGLVANDEILEVNGKAASRISIEKLRDWFKGPVGTRISLNIRNRGGRRSALITLAEQI